MTLFYNIARYTATDIGWAFLCVTVPDTITLNLLYPSLKDPDILLTIEYIDKQVYVKTAFNGEKMDLAQKLSQASPSEAQDNTDVQNISLNILKAYYDEVWYEYQEDDPRPNHLVLKIK